jgi:hypothetical protein
VYGYIKNGIKIHDKKPKRSLNAAENIRKKKDDVNM